MKQLAYGFFPAIALVAILSVGGLQVGCTTARGEKIGTVTKVSQEGAVCQTWEGTIIRGGISGGTGAFSQPFDFTIKSEDLVKKANDYMIKGQEVKIKYTHFFPTLCSSTSGYFVYSIEPIK